MTDITVNRWRFWKRTAVRPGKSMTKFLGEQIVVIFGADDTPNGRILSKKGGAK